MIFFRDVPAKVNRILKLVRSHQSVISNVVVACYPSLAVEIPLKTCLVFINPFSAISSFFPPQKITENTVKVSHTQTNKKN